MEMLKRKRKNPIINEYLKHSNDAVGISYRTRKKFLEEYKKNPPDHQVEPEG